MIRCPGCNQWLEALTSVHCQKEHGLSKNEFTRLYGQPHTTSARQIPHLKRFKALNDRDYTNYQLFDLRFRSTNRLFHSDR